MIGALIASTSLLNGVPQIYAQRAQPGGVKFGLSALGILPVTGVSAEDLFEPEGRVPQAAGDRQNPADRRI